MKAVEFLCDIRFHHSFVLPPNPSTGRPKPLRISYADYGDSNSDAVVLFCGALMGTRFCYSPLDRVAKNNHVRIVHPDRPGIGGSEGVEQGQRIEVWLEMIPALLSHLSIPHVSLASHSGGIIYALNTLLTYPHLLHPQRPYITFFAPWVHHSHSRIHHLRATELLPAPLIGRFASMARFVNDNVVPLAGLGSTFFHGIREAFHHSRQTPAPVPLAPTPSSLSRAGSRASMESWDSRTSGVDLDDPEVVEEMRQLIIEYLFAEAIEGIGADAKLFLKKPSTIQWCSSSIFWSDIDYVVPLLAKIIEKETDEEGGKRKWTIDAFHAQFDNMIGERGRLWFDECWKSYAVPSYAVSEQDLDQKNLEFRSEVVTHSEHNYLMDPAYGACDLWLERVRESFPAPEEKIEDENENENEANKSDSALGSREVRKSPFVAIISRAKRITRTFGSRRRTMSTLAVSNENVGVEKDISTGDGAETDTQTSAMGTYSTATKSMDECSSTRGLRKGKMGTGLRGGSRLNGCAF